MDTRGSRETRRARLIQAQSRRPEQLVKFALVALAVVATRAFDILTTYRATPSLAEEANPLARLFGFGWPALLTSNALISALVIVGAWRAIMGAESALPEQKGLTFNAFVSSWWFGDLTRPWWHAFFRRARDPRLMWYALSSVTAPVVIVMGIFVGVHNAHHYSDRRTLGLAVALLYGFGVVASIAGLNLFFRAQYRRYERLTSVQSRAA